MDANGDGQLSPNEAGREQRKLATRRVMRTSRFERLDTNADGELDRDSDGNVSREEMQAARAKKKS